MLALRHHLSFFRGQNQPLGGRSFLLRVSSGLNVMRLFSAAWVVCQARAVLCGFTVPYASWHDVRPAQDTRLDLTAIRLR
jgi:hypothetical protein